MNTKLKEYPTASLSESPDQSNCRKSTKWDSQKKRVFTSLFETPQTRLQVSSRTNVPIQNVCRFVSQYRKAGNLYVLKSGTCPISGMQAEIITTNQAFAMDAIQIDLFNGK